ncbi:MAG: GDP-mannose 4,6-dehydratase [bacterium]
MKYLITGAAGFIGSSVAKKLLENGEEVFGLDCFNDYYNPEYKRQNTAELEKFVKFHLLEGDFTNREFVEEVFSENKFDKIIHLAARAGVRNSIADPTLYNQVNVMGTLNLLEAAKKYGPKDFIFASSSSVYGNNKKVPFAESDDVNSPASPYAATKKAGELMCYTYHYLFGLNTTCLRFFSVYGPKGRPDMAPYLFTEAIIKNQPIKKFGDGSMKRDWTYIDDIVNGVIAAAKKSFPYEIINLGNSKPIDLNSFIANIEEAIGKKAIIEESPKPKEDVAITYADTKKAEQLLGFKPSTSFTDGIKIFVDWYKTNRS